jgi:hypothetical protein
MSIHEHMCAYYEAADGPTDPDRRFIVYDHAGKVWAFAPHRGAAESLVWRLNHHQAAAAASAVGETGQADR